MKKKKIKLHNYFYDIMVAARSHPKLGENSPSV